MVVDANTILPLFLPGPHSATVAQLFERTVWRAPPLWRSELRNVITRGIRADRLTLVEARDLMAEAHDVLDDYTIDVPSTPILRLASASGCTAYDCEYVALAQLIDEPLATYDKALLRAFPATCTRPDDYLQTAH